MEVLILDALLRPIDVVDTFISMIWAERFSEKGDFELVTLSTPANQRRFTKGTWITITESKRIMEVQTVQDKIDTDGTTILTIKGFEITDIVLDTRLALKAIGVGELAPVWYILDKTPGDVMRYIFTQICVVGSVTSDDIIPYYYTGGLYSAGTIPEPSAHINWEQKPASVYEALRELGSIYDLGHRLYKDPNLSKLYFEVYAGSDRTSAQTTLPAVIFSVDMENLQNTTDYSTTAGSYNVVQVMYIHKDTVDPELDVVTTEVVHANESDRALGFDRRVKVLLITSIPDDVVDIPAFLIQAGRDELLKFRPLGAFDGEISQYSQYVYERDYFLGDLVESRGRSGASNYMRVMEQIFVQDASGQRSYPTLVTKEFINPGTWKSWKYDVAWSAMGSTEFWANQ